MTPRDLWVAFLAALSYVPRPDVAEAVRQQRAVTGDTHSRKACQSPCFCDRCYRATMYEYAGLYAQAGLMDMAAQSLIAASGNGTCRIVNPKEAS